jgi:hypothetical protein
MSIIFTHNVEFGKCFLKKAGAIAPAFHTSALRFNNYIKKPSIPWSNKK